MRCCPLGSISCETSPTHVRGQAWDETHVHIHCMSRELIDTVPVPSHLGVKLPATPAPRRALDDEELFVIEGSKNPSTPGLNPSRTSPKNGAKCAEKPFIAPNSRKAYLSLLRTGMSTKSSDELNLSTSTVQENNVSA